MTPEESVEIALFEKAKEYTDLPLIFPNYDEVPPTDGSSFVEVRHFRNNSQIRTFVDEDYYVGILQMMVHCPLGKGPGEARARAGDIADLFPKNLSLWHAGLRVRISKRPVLGTAVPSDVKFRVPVSIYYETSF